jgi:hypothetical protein
LDQPVEQWPIVLHRASATPPIATGKPGLPEGALTVILLPYYLYNKKAEAMPKKLVERTQTGVRIEKSLLKVLKGLAEYCDLTLGDLLEGILLHAFEGKAPFSEQTLAAIRDLKTVYGCDLTAADSHQLTESDS